jgi:inorganic pyrophosphatase
MDSDGVIHCIVEIPKGRRNKYEYDPALGAIRLDRFISSSVVYPTDYGFIPGTLSRDGDSLDAMICVSEPTFPGCIVLARPVGLLEMADELVPPRSVRPVRRSRLELATAHGRRARPTAQ